MTSIDDSIFGTTYSIRDTVRETEGDNERRQYQYRNLPDYSVEDKELYEVMKNDYKTK